MSASLQKLSLGGAVDFLSKIYERITTISFVSGFIFSSRRVPDAYKCILMGPTHIMYVEKKHKTITPHITSHIGMHIIILLSCSSDFSVLF